VITEGEQFNVVLQFAGDTTPDVLGRMGQEIPDDLDDRLRALASGELNIRERNRLLEKLVDCPELLLRLATYLRESED